MIDWIGDRKYKVYAWSESDRNQLLHEITAKQITDESVDAFIDGGQMGGLSKLVFSQEISA